MPSTRGWAALGAALGLGVLWVAFGERELLALALFLVLGTAGGVALVRLATPRVEVHRRISPEHLHEGDRAIVEISVTTRRPLRNVIVEDRVAELGAARFAAAHIDSRTPLVARYEVLARPRGVYEVGPASVAAADVLGLAEAGGDTGTIDRLTVFPMVEALEGFPLVRGRDPSVQTSHPTFAPHGGEDFFTLREYAVGDDLRRVHWPSSAKRGELMIRQLEVPWQSRALILLDTRDQLYPDDASFEHAVSGAASVIHHLHQGGYGPHLWTGEVDARSLTYTGYLACMNRLATVRPTTVDLRRGVTRLHSAGVGGGALVMVTGTADDAVLAAFRYLARSFGRTLVLAVGNADDATLAMMQRSGAATISVAPGESWTAAWAKATESTWRTASAG
jgi:uncharacterized protein (DUF58 family)